MMKQKKKQQSKMMMASALAVLMILVVAAIVGIGKTVAGARETMVAFTPEAVLASAGVEDGANITLPVKYVDQKQDKCVNSYDANAAAQVKSRQFEWTSCGYDIAEIEEGLVDFYLGEDYLPVAMGGNLSYNRGMKDMTRWFTTVEGKSKEQAGTLALNYSTSDDASFYYYNDKFYPLDEMKFSEGDSKNTDGHNHLFTMNFLVPFTVAADGGESFTITADDDTFVFVGDKLAIDMGGVHGVTKGRFEIKENGEVYAGVGEQELAYTGITVENSSMEVVRIFHADRDSKDSVFGVEFNNMKLAVINSQLAGTDGVQIAYDPSDPSYVAPLGESEVVRPHITKQYIITMTVLGMAVVVLAMMAAMVAYRAVKK